MSKANEIAIKILGEDLYSNLIPYYHKLQGEPLYRIKKQKKVPIKFVGSKIDGGFAFVESLLQKKPIIFSFGLGENLTFSEGMRVAYDAEIYGFDPSIIAIDYYSRHWLKKDEKFHFFSMGLSNEDKVVTFYQPKFMDGSDHSCSEFLHYKSTVDGAYEVQLNSLATVLNKINFDKKRVIDIFKMDIEGSEFDVISTIFDNNLNIGQFCIEVHPRFFENGKEKNANMIKVMNEHNYSLTWVSPDYTVLTFSRNDLLESI